MKKAFEIFVEMIFWIAIFASPFLLSVAIGMIIYSSNPNLFWFLMVISFIGFVCGIFLAERIRKKCGCTNYMSKIFS